MVLVILGLKIDDIRKKKRKRWSERKESKKLVSLGLFVFHVMAAVVAANNYLIFIKIVEHHYLFKLVRFCYCWLSSPSHTPPFVRPFSMTHF